MWLTRRLSKKSTISDKSAWVTEGETKNSTNSIFTPLSPSTTTLPSQTPQPDLIPSDIVSSDPLKTHSLGPVTVILIAILVPLLCTSLWLLTLSLRRSRSTDILSQLDAAGSEASLETRGSWETVVVDLPSLLDPPEPAVAGIGRLWARVTNRREPTLGTGGGASLEWVGVEDAALGPLEWYAKHTPATLSYGQPVTYPRLTSSCQKSIYSSDQLSRSWSLA